MSVPEQLTGLVMKRPGSTSHNFYYYYLKIFSTWWKKIKSTFPISRINKTHGVQNRALKEFKVRSKDLQP